jgi:hypothetical protein
LLLIHNHLENNMFVNFKNAARLAGVGIGIASLAASPAFAQSTAAPEVQLKAPAATAPNMMIVRDPVTGQLRAPTAEEAAALQQTPAAAARAGRAASAQASQASPSAPSAPLTKSHSNGARGVRLTDEMATYSVATRRADGTLEIEHVEGKKAADAEVKAAKVAPAVPTVATE